MLIECIPWGWHLLYRFPMIMIWNTSNRIDSWRVSSYFGLFFVFSLQIKHKWYYSYNFCRTLSNLYSIYLYPFSLPPFFLLILFKSFLQAFSSFPSLPSFCNLSISQLFYSNPLWMPRVYLFNLARSLNILYLWKFTGCNCIKWFRVCFRLAVGLHRGFANFDHKWKKRSQGGQLNQSLNIFLSMFSVPFDLRKRRTKQLCQVSCNFIAAVLYCQHKRHGWPIYHNVFVERRLASTMSVLQVTSRKSFPCKILQVFFNHGFLSLTPSLVQSSSNC